MHTKYRNLITSESWEFTNWCYRDIT